MSSVNRVWIKLMAEPLVSGYNNDVITLFPLNKLQTSNKGKYETSNLQKRAISKHNSMKPLAHRKNIAHQKSTTCNLIP